MLLETKNAVIYGGGLISGAVARAFAREGATIFLAGRNPRRLAEVAEEVHSVDGEIETAVIDALDERQVDEHADAVAGSVGTIDISFNLISMGDVQGALLAEMSPEDVLQPVVNSVRAMFLSSRAAARHMIPQGSGVILTFGGYGDPVPYVGGLQVAFGAVEALRRGLACELGPHGIRVLTLQTGGIVETMSEDFAPRDAVVKSIVDKTMLGRAATLEDVGNVAVFAASDLAGSMTGTALNITCGSEVG